MAAGGIVAGYTLFVKDRKPVYEYNWFTQARYKVAGTDALPAGPCKVRVEFKYDGGGVGKGGTATLFANDKKVGEGRIEKTVPGRFSADETFDVGMDTGSPVSADYASPNRFTGKLGKITIDLAPHDLTADDQSKVHAMQRAAELAKH
jgi:arylsulfatase